MKHLKQKLVAATAMLLISAVMLSSVSYAWFTLSTNPEVKGMTATVSANQNLEIALDNKYADGDAVDDASANTAAGGVQGSTSGNYYTWGNLIDLTDGFTVIEGKTDDSPDSKLNLQPVKFTSGVLAEGNTRTDAQVMYGSFDIPAYGVDGRIKEMKDLTATHVHVADGTTNGNTSQVETDNATSGLVAYADGAGDSSEGYKAFSVAYWLRTNVDGSKVSLSEAVKRANDGDDAKTGAAESTDPNYVLGGGSTLKVTADKVPTAATVAEGDADPVAAYWGEIEEYLKHLKIVFYDETDENAVKEVFTATIDMTANNVEASDDNKEKTYKLTAQKVKEAAAGESGQAEGAGTETVEWEDAFLEMEKDKAYKLVMYVYIDGETITNKDALLDDVDIALNIQFQSDKITPTVAEGSTDTATEGAMDGTPVETTAAPETP